jgi:hypothetical protein
MRMHGRGLRALQSSFRCARASLFSVPRLRGRHGVQRVRPTRAYPDATTSAPAAAAPSARRRRRSAVEQSVYAAPSGKTLATRRARARGTDRLVFDRGLRDSDDDRRCRTRRWLEPAAAVDRAGRRARLGFLGNDRRAARRDLPGFVPNGPNCSS